MKKHFSKFVSPELADNAIWFEFEGCPLKWHLPIGVLYDQALLLNKDLNPPWAITIHYDKYPSKEILQCQSR